MKPKKLQGESKELRKEAGRLLNKEDASHKGVVGREAGPVRIRAEELMLVDSSQSSNAVAQ